mmetsp:Transcript_8928/g.26232  ORF Transcript_8928/g.26232 Transcript_8928/m.26232 type:complete len:319 (-) Transcript_8928:157-1113(-)
MAVTAGLPLQPDDEVLADIPEEEKAADPLQHARVARIVSLPGGGSQEFTGEVVEIEVGTLTGDRLYRVRYADGDLQHFTAEDVRQWMCSEPGKEQRPNGVPVQPAEDGPAVAAEAAVLPAEGDAAPARAPLIKASAKASAKASSKALAAVAKAPAANSAPPAAAVPSSTRQYPVPATLAQEQDVQVDVEEAQEPVEVAIVAEEQDEAALPFAEAVDSADAEMVQEVSMADEDDGLAPEEPAELQPAEEFAEPQLAEEVGMDALAEEALIVLEDEDEEDDLEAGKLEEAEDEAWDGYAQEGEEPPAKRSRLNSDMEEAT